jgi:hypothetical protein
MTIKVGQQVKIIEDRRPRLGIKTGVRSKNDRFPIIGIVTKVLDDGTLIVLIDGYITVNIKKNAVEQLG